LGSGNEAEHRAGLRGEGGTVKRITALRRLTAVSGDDRARYPLAVCLEESDGTRWVAMLCRDEREARRFEADLIRLQPYHPAAMAFRIVVVPTSCTGADG
jgi:hypothetical protein